MNLYEDFLNLSLAIIRSENSLENNMQSICDLLDNKLVNYDWIGFYMTNIENRTLHLRPYNGKASEHKTIPYGNGICGQVTKTEKTFRIDDLNSESNYISCSIHVKSEIVAPIIKNGIMVGQIDMDSNTPAAFKQQDQYLSKKICSELANYL